MRTLLATCGKRAYSVARLKTPVNGHITLKESIAVVKKREMRKKHERQIILDDSTKHLLTFEKSLLNYKYNNGELKRAKTTIFQVNIGNVN